jgi:hypothetical protein
MGLIGRRWTITFDSEGRPRVVGEHADARALRNGWTTVEVIPAADARGAVSLADVCEFLRSATYHDPGTGRDRHPHGYKAAAADLERHFGGQ